MVLNTLGAQKPALRCLLLDCALRPANGGIYADIANVLAVIGDRRGLPAYCKSLALAPRREGARMNLGNLVGELSEDLKLSLYKSLVALAPQDYRSHYNLGTTLTNYGGSVDKVGLLLRAIAMAPSNTSCWVNTANAYQRAGYLEPSMYFYKALIAIDPGFGNAWTNVGNWYKERGEFIAASICYRRSYKLNPIAANENNWGIMQLTLGRLEDGRAGYSKRGVTGVVDLGHQDLGLPRWQGEPVTGGRLLIWGEQGVGDELMFASLLPEVLDICPDPIIEISERLVPFLRHRFPQLEIVARSKPRNPRLLKSDIVCDIALADLIFIFGLTLVGDVRPRPSLIVAPQKLPEQLGREYRKLFPGKRLVGVSWRSKGLVTGAFKTAPIDGLEAVAALPDVQLINLQYGDVKLDLERFETRTGHRIFNDPRINQFQSIKDFAGQIAALDHVVTTSNTTVHVAGSLGVPTTLVLHSVPDWRWQLTGTSCPWYSSVTVVRQAVPGDWSGAFRRAARAAADSMAGRQPLFRAPEERDRLRDRGLAALAEGRTEEAVDRLFEVVEASRFDPFAYANLAVAYEGLKKFGHAHIWASVAVRAAPNHSRLLYNCARFADRSYPGAGRRLFELGTALDPALEQNWSELVGMAYRSGLLGVAKRLVAQVERLAGREATARKPLYRLVVAVAGNAQSVAMAVRASGALPGTRRPQEAAVADALTRDVGLVPEFTPANALRTLEEAAAPLVGASPVLAVSRAAFGAAIEPGNPRAVCQVGGALERMARSAGFRGEAPLRRAAACYRLATALAPGDPLPRKWGLALSLARGAFMTAAQQAHHVMRLGVAAGDGQVFQNLGESLRVLIPEKRWNLGLAMASALIPGDTAVRGTVITNAPRHPGSYEAFARAITLVRQAPATAEILLNLSTFLRYGGHHAAAEALIRRVLALRPEDRDAAHNLAICLLAAGKLEEGWRYFDHRLTAPQQRIGNRGAGLPRWHGEEGRSVYFWSEQGVGDHIMYASCLPDALKVAERAVIDCDVRLVPLFDRSFPSATVVPLSDPNGPSRDIGEADVEMPMGSLLAMFRRAESDFPRRAFLVPDREKVDGYRRRLEEAHGAGKRFVGISWRSGNLKQGPGKSLDILEFAPLLAAKDVVLVSFQYGEAQADLDRFEAETGHRPMVFDDLDPTMDIDGLAALCCAVDQVVTVSNVTAHLAGALGQKVVNMIQPAVDWRWFTDRVDTPWYPNMTLIRQSRMGDWSGMMSKVRKILY